MDRSEALNALRREYQADYQKEIRAARDMVSAGVRGLRGTETLLSFDDRDSFVALGHSRKKFTDALDRAIRPLLDAYARELEREAAQLGIGGKVDDDGPLMESLHDAMRHLQESAAGRPVQQGQVPMPPHVHHQQQKIA